MKNRLWMGSVAALAMSAGLAVACGDDDDSGTNLTPTPDGGGSTTVDSAPPATADAGSGTDGSITDAAVAPPVTPVGTTRIANAINPYGLLFASDGFLYASGATMDNGRKLAVWRFKDGALDTTFGSGGVISTDIAGDESSYDIVEVSAGNFVVHAIADGKVWLVKLTKEAGGTFTFGTPVFVKFGWNENEAWPDGTPSAPALSPRYTTSWGIALDKSNAAAPKIVVFASGAPPKAANAADQRIDSDRWITRVSADTLAFDPTFNNGAPFSTDADGKKLGDNVRRGIVLADGSIVSAGYTNFGAGLGNHVVLIRLLANGAVDPAFGFGTTAPGIPGQTKFNPFVAASGFAEAYGVARQSSGRLVTTGYGTTNFDAVSKNVDVATFGVKADGLDTAYGKLGALAFQSENDKSAGLGAAPHTERGRDLVVLSDDRVVHVGVYDDYAALYVTDKDGKPDPQSGAKGIIEYAYPAGFFKVALSPDGKQIATTTQSLNQTGDAGAPVGSVLAMLKVGL